jgi:tetratricopeptide (TPR) repeat protein
MESEMTQKQGVWKFLLGVIGIAIVLSFFFLYRQKQAGLITTAKREGNAQYSQEIQKQMTDLKGEIEKNPSDNNLWRSLGQLYYTLGDLTSARKNAEKAIELNPQDYLSYSFLGDVAKDMGDLVVAEEAYLKTISRGPLYSNGYIKLADFYKSDAVKKYDKVEGVYLDAIEITKDSYFLKAEARWLDSQGNIQGAIDYWKEALKAEPETADLINAEIARLQKMLKVKE